MNGRADNYSAKMDPAIFGRLLKPIPVALALLAAFYVGRLVPAGDVWLVTNDGGSTECAVFSSRARAEEYATRWANLDRTRRKTLTRRMSIDRPRRVFVPQD